MFSDMTIESGLLNSKRLILTTFLHCFAQTPSTQPRVRKGPGRGMSAARMRNWRVTGGNDVT